MRWDYQRKKKRNNRKLKGNYIKYNTVIINGKNGNITNRKKKMLQEGRKRR